MAKPLTPQDLKPGERVVTCLEHYFDAFNVADGKFSHGLIADQFARKAAKAYLDAVALNHFEALFQALNKLLPP